MIKLPISFTNFDGQNVTEDWWFHLDVAEIIELQASMEHEGGFEGRYQKMMEKKNVSGMFDMLRGLVLMTVGKRSDDGKRFVKTDEVRDDFQHGGAYSALVVMLMTGQVKPDVFFNGVMPANLKEQAEKIRQNALKQNPEATAEIERQISSYSLEELLEMSDEDFKALAKKNKGNNLPQNFLLAGMQRATRD